MKQRDDQAVRNRAHLRMLGYAFRCEDAVEEADRCTSVADARIALCLAVGVPERYIDPARGYDYSDASYERVARSWLQLAQDNGLSRFFDGPAYERAMESWRRHRPDLDVGGWVPEELMRD